MAMATGNEKCGVDVNLPAKYLKVFVGKLLMGYRIKESIGLIEIGEPTVLDANFHLCKSDRTCHPTHS